MFRPSVFEHTEDFCRDVCELMTGFKEILIKFTVVFLLPLGYDIFMHAVTDCAK